MQESLAEEMIARFNLNKVRLSCFLSAEISNRTLSAVLDSEEIWRKHSVFIFAFCIRLVSKNGSVGRFCPRVSTGLFC